MASQPNLQQSNGRQLQSAIPIHPAALLFPMMAEDELNKLADDIAANDLLEPIIVFQGQILDGRNRLAACELADVEPKFIEVSDETVPSPALYVLSRNLHRRHLTTSQRAAIAADVVPMLEDERRVHSLANLKVGTKTPMSPSGDIGRSTEIAAKELQVSPRSVQRAVAVKRDDPEAFERVKRGEITVNEANHDEEKRKPRPPKTPPGELNGHDKRHAETYKKRMITALSTITGLCRGLDELNVQAALSVCDEEERSTWIDRAKELASQLRAFSARLQKGNNNGE